MQALRTTKVSASTTAHGSGAFGGKGEGLAFVDGLALDGVQRLRTEIFSDEIYQRYREGGNVFDRASREHLRQVLASFARSPIGVRASGAYENDPRVAVSGESVSFMLPNHDPDPAVRFAQLLRAIGYIFDDFAAKAAREPARGEGGAFLINPIPGVESHTRAGRIFHPMSSGVADSFCKHPLQLADGLQDPHEGFARIAFGHGYAVVRDDFDVVPLATIRRPLDPRLLIKGGQRFFYAIDLDGAEDFGADELSTMTTLNMRFADPALRAIFADERDDVTFHALVVDDRFGYRSGLTALVEQIKRHCEHFQIEFTWNLVDGKGVFHVVQFLRLRQTELKSLPVPAFDEHALIRSESFGGHGVTDGVRHAIVINPFNYRDEHYDEVLRELRRANDALGAQGERYILVCPGRIGTRNRRWGFFIDYRSVCHAAALVEYGYDVRGSPTIEIERDEMTGGIYGSHFLYQILGGAAEAERRQKARLFGSQGTHFLTNLYTSGTVYVFVNPVRDHLSRWFFSPPPDRGTAPIYVKRFDAPATIYANLLERCCLVRAAP